MKTVFTSDELPHTWIHERAPHGRAPSSMSFGGSRFLSYSTPIAAWHKLPNGDKVVFLNTVRYSNTTKRHQSLVRRAIPESVRIFKAETKELESPSIFVRSCVEIAEGKMISASDLRAKHPRRKKEAEEMEVSAVHHMKTACEVAELFQLAEFARYPWGVSHEDVKARVAARVAAEKKRVTEKERKAKENLKKWLAGDMMIPIFSLPEGKTFFRVLTSQAGPRLQSSKGVIIEISEARSALAFILSKRKSGWQKNGERFPVAGYELDSISTAGVVAGCHRFDWQEIERVKGLLSSI